MESATADVSDINLGLYDGEDPLEPAVGQGAVEG
jgi:hypothetical protein